MNGASVTRSMPFFDRACGHLHRRCQYSYTIALNPSFSNKHLYNLYGCTRVSMASIKKS